MAQEYDDLLTPPDFVKRAESFFREYELISVRGGGDPLFSKRSLKPKDQRICSFCGRRQPEVKFATQAHLVPQLIGNGDLYSDFECDDCNKRFSKFEGDLAAYLGIARSLTGLGDEGRPPGFVAKRISAKSRSYIGDNVLILHPQDIVRDGIRSTFTYTKNKFVPANVYKALLKSGLSLLGSSEIMKNYPHAIMYLNGKFDIPSDAWICGYTLSFKINLPLHIFHFCKREATATIATDMMLFCFQNQMLAIPMLLHRDFFASKDGTFSVVPPPPLFGNEDTMNRSMPQFFRRDFCSPSMVIDEQEKIVIEVDPIDAANAVSFDPETKVYKKTPLGDQGIKYMIISRDGFQLENADELLEFIRKEMEGAENSSR